MQFNTVLVLVTGKPSDLRAVDYASSLVRDARGRLIVLYVIKVDRAHPLDVELPEEVRIAEEVLRRAERAADLQRNVEAEMLQARDIGSAVVHEAAVRDVDAIVISTEYPMTNGQYSLGTDIPYVLEFAACNVVLVREAVPGARPERRQIPGRTGSTAG